MNDMARKISKLDKLEVLSVWMAKSRVEGDTHLDLLFELDDLHQSVYKKNRIFSFAKAQAEANKTVLKLFFEDEVSSMEREKQLKKYLLELIDSMTLRMANEELLKLDDSAKIIEIRKYLDSINESKLPDEDIFKYVP